ncbi:TPA: hypothetical protein L9W38_003566 [Klebsiella pneumoniae]|nr:hypothetical protein [Klebsiella pneumoniae]
MWDDWYNRVFYTLCFVAFILLSLSLLDELTAPDSKDLIRDGKHWVTDCTLKEVDISTGFLTSNINRLDCSGVVVNVVKEKYDQAVSAYNKSK